MNATINLLIIASSVIFVACSAQKKLAGQVSGEWVIEYYENKKPDESSATMTNIGSITFHKDGSGSKSISYSIMGSDYVDSKSFQWNNTDNTVTITGHDESMISKSWIVLKSSSKSQDWRSTDSQGNVQIMKLRKK